MPKHRLPVLVLSLIAFVALGTAVGLRVAEQKARSGFWGDEATYHSMAWSLARDGDIRYERRDLERVYAAGYGGGPSGLFLVRNPDDGSLYFAKAFAYSLFAAPLVRLLGDNGFFALHALLLAAMLAAGYLYASRGTSPGVAALITATYVLASSVTVYFFWLTPEWFNLALVFLSMFLWLYKEPGPWGIEAPERGWLSRPWTDVAAAVLMGIAIFSKPPNAVLLLPLVAWSLLRGRWLRGIGLGLVACLVVAAFFGATWAWIGDWNYQGGDRRQFNAATSYPLLSPDETFDSVGISMTTNMEDVAGGLPALPPAATVGRDLLYVWLGRNAGMLAYMFPAVAALLAFVALPQRRWRGPHGLLVATFLLYVVAVVLVLKGNWIGGGGTIGSRYLVSAYPLLFFVVPPVGAVATAAASWAVWGLFVSQIVLSPFSASFSPSMHTKRFPYTLLPTELTLLHNLPFNTDPRARLVRMSNSLAYFLDDDTFRLEAGLEGFWVKGGSEAELVLRTGQPPEEIIVEIRNRGLPNRVTVRHGARIEELRMAPDERASVRLPAQVDHAYYYEDLSYLYLLSISSEATTIPMFDTPGSLDLRPLGVFVRPRMESGRAPATGE